MSGCSGAPHLHKVALKDGEVSQLVKLAAQEVALEASGPARGIGRNQGAFWRGKVRGSSPGSSWAGPPQLAGPRKSRSDGRGIRAISLLIASPIPHLVASPGPTQPGPAPPLTCHPTWSLLTCSTGGRLNLVPPHHRNAPPHGESGGRCRRRKRVGGGVGSISSQRGGPGLNVTKETPVVVTSSQGAAPRDQDEATATGLTSDLREAGGR